MPCGFAAASTLRGTTGDTGRDGWRERNAAYMGCDRGVDTITSAGHSLTVCWTADHRERVVATALGCCFVAKRVPEGPAPDPAVQKVRLQYAKRGRLRFSSSRDFQRALERAIRRAELPIAFSAGFHPHPKISYANAAPTGAASEAEYFEIQLTRECDPDRVRSDLDAALPPGLDILRAVTAGPGGLADRLEASTWQLAFPAGTDVDALRAAVQTLLDTELVEVTRMMKAGPKTFDMRAALVDAKVGDDGQLSIVVRHQAPSVRPDDVVAALASVAGFRTPRPPVATRIEQGPLEGTAIGDPLS